MQTDFTEESASQNFWRVLENKQKLINALHKTVINVEVIPWTMERSDGLNKQLENLDIQKIQSKSQ